MLQSWQYIALLLWISHLHAGGQGTSAGPALDRPGVTNIEDALSELVG